MKLQGAFYILSYPLVEFLNQGSPRLLTFDNEVRHQSFVAVILAWRFPFSLLYGGLTCRGRAPWNLAHVLYLTVYVIVDMRARTIAILLMDFCRHFSRHIYMKGQAEKRANDKIWFLIYGGTERCVVCTMNTLQNHDGDKAKNTIGLTDSKRFPRTLVATVPAPSPVRRSFPVKESAVLEVRIFRGACKQAKGTAAGDEKVMTIYTL